MMSIDKVKEEAKEFYEKYSEKLNNKEIFDKVSNDLKGTTSTKEEV
jgi:hypothetical protein